MNIDLVFKIAGLGIIISVLAMVLKQAGKEELAQMLTLGGVVVVLLTVVELIRNLYMTVRSVFQLY